MASTRPVYVKGFKRTFCADISTGLNVSPSLNFIAFVFILCLLHIRTAIHFRCYLAFNLVRSIFCPLDVEKALWGRWHLLLFFLWLCSFKKTAFPMFLNYYSLFCHLILHLKPRKSPSTIEGESIIRSMNELILKSETREKIHLWSN